ILDKFDLAPRLVFDRLHDVADRIHVLDLAARAEGRSRAPHGDVAVTAEAAFLHVAVACAEIAQDRAQLAEIGARFLGAAKIGLRDDLHQRDAGPVEIDICPRRMLIVQTFAGILLEMEPGNTDLARGAVGHVERDPSLAHDGTRVLRDLVARGQVGVEIVLAVEDRHQIDLGGETEPGLHRLLDAMPVDHRKHAGKRGIDERNLRVGLRSKGRRRAGKELRFGNDLRVRLETDDNFPGPGAALDERRHQRPPPARSGFAVKAAALSMTPATRSTVSSSKARPITCNPSGSPSDESPAGTEIPGRPARFTGTVNISFRYMAIGSSCFSPMAKAAEGAVGVSIASQRVNASAKSRAIKVRTRCAFR